MSDARKATGPDRANDQPRQETHHSAILHPLEIPDNTAKRQATLIANFAMAGHVVHRTSDGGFLVCRHGYVKHCPDLPALAGFAKQTGVTR